MQVYHTVPLPVDQPATGIFMTAKVQHLIDQLNPRYNHQKHELFYILIHNYQRFMEKLTVNAETCLNFGRECWYYWWRV